MKSDRDRERAGNQGFTFRPMQLQYDTREVSMNRFNKYLAATFILSALLLTNAAEAMPIQQYDRMSANDQADYTSLLVGGAEQVLKDAGRPDEAAQVEHLFTTRREAGDKITLGMVELELNMSVVRQADADNLVKNPNAKPVQVEIAMILTLKNNGIILPKNFIHVGDSFQPKDRLSPAPMVPTPQQKH